MSHDLSMLFDLKDATSGVYKTIGGIVSYVIIS
jgi:hypothetical protein